MTGAICFIITKPDRNFILCSRARAWKEKVFYKMESAIDKIKIQFY